MSSKQIQIYLFIIFNYSFQWQNNVKALNLEQPSRNYANLLLEIHNIAMQLKLFIYFFSFYFEIKLKSKDVCYNCKKKKGVKIVFLNKIN